MKKMTATSLALLILSQPGWAADPDEVVWEGSGWQVAEMLNASGRFVGCYAVKDFQAPIFIQINRGQP